MNSSPRCPLDNFRCYYGACISNKFKCDGIKQCADGSDESQCGRKAGSCEINEYKCSTGECIPLEKLCDGNADCKENSDETNICDKVTACPPSTHRCKVGSCVYLSQRCDGRRDCIDGSDESELLCKNLECREGECQNKVTSKIYCPPVKSNRINAHCEVPFGLNMGIIPCDVPLPPGTIVHHECKPYYIPASTSHKNNSQMICQSDGTWNREQLRCIPDCGVADLEVAPLIVNGWITEQGKFPWHAVLFTLEEGNWTFTCGGSLITERIVLTAAHCTWNSYEEILRIGLGKHYSDYYKEEDYAQIVNISKIIRQPAYQDLAGNYGSDIAILVLTGSVDFSPVIRPTCIDWNLDDITEHLSHNKLGLIAGMGVTENNTFSTRLRGTYLPVIESGHCIEKQKKDFKKYISFTSFCAGWENGTGVCNGDSGGGLVFPSEQNPNKFTIQGIVSVSPRRPGTSFCDPNYYTVFTKVGMYVRWIYDTLQEIHDDESDNSQVIL
ncbi:modular serine protease-like isoform X2 [Tenebrio molitor]|uniref:modular serine protease-like isoform X2 n=1 Tax=Tenebrio molitor TaxID=7067 RepID=UPI00362493E0